MHPWHIRKGRLSKDGTSCKQSCEGLRELRDRQDIKAAPRQHSNTASHTQAWLGASRAAPTHPAKVLAAIAREQRQRRRGVRGNALLHVGADERQARRRVQLVALGQQTEVLGAVSAGLDLTKEL
jgi:hypothetical protein